MPNAVRVLNTPIYRSIPLFEFVNKDDEILSNSPDQEWYRILKNMPYQNYQNLAAAYYCALYDFNQKNKKNELSCSDNNSESKEKARQRVLFDRPTMDKSKPILDSVEPEEITTTPPSIKPELLLPGVVPTRKLGKKPKCFFAMFYSFIGVMLMGFPPEPEVVFNLLTSNLSFARVCGFIPDVAKEYWFKNIPSLRKLEQFDQIMTQYGLWNSNKRDEVCQNLTKEVIMMENELVGDTTHYHAFSSFETVPVENKNGKIKGKSQSKMTKNCRCSDQEHCPHEWILADDGAGTIVKSHKKMIWGHKASVIGFPIQGIPLDATAVADAATNDGETFYPHVKNLFEDLPMIQPFINRVLYDSACDRDDLRIKFEEKFEIKLCASFNPRRKATVTEDLPKGMDKLTPYGNLYCRAGHIMDYQGVRWDSEKFIYQAPVDENDIIVCENCPNKNECCPNAKKGRTVTVSFQSLPHIRPEDPPMAKRYKAIMTRRPSVERMIKRLKCDLSDDRLTKRGNASFQAYLDKTLTAFHILLRQ